MNNPHTSSDEQELVTFPANNQYDIAHQLTNNIPCQKLLQIYLDRRDPPWTDRGYDSFHYLLSETMMRSGVGAGMTINPFWLKGYQICAEPSLKTHLYQEWLLYLEERRPSTGSE